MQFGLSENIIQEIIQIITKKYEIDKIILFGSRAIGNYKNGSDIDLALISKNLTYSDLLDLQVELDKQELIYKIDIIAYNTISELALKEHIDRVGILLYQK